MSHEVERSAGEAVPGLHEPLGGNGDASRGWLRYGEGAPGIERLAASFCGRPFAAHRHDTYAVGVTLAGVQTFSYRGRRHVCLPGEAHVLHPDEAHDGAAGTERGFAYRIVYLDPALVCQALGGRPLPFVADPVIGRSEVEPGLLAALRSLDEPLGALEAVELCASLARFLERRAGRARAASASLPLGALQRARQLIADDPATTHDVEVLEQVSGLDRWTLARRFRQAFGTSPSRFRTMRRLDRARRLVGEGLPLAQAALEAGFADQSHLTRMFKRAYGLTPGRWHAVLD
ncbi:MAG TPA: AraC family transcriptional regulator [Trueperaceae bacterium]|nr:AraC family transcriptional regulator [Trueperaceae bacterium]